MGMSPGFLSQRSLKAVLSSQVISGTNHRSELPAQTPASFRLPASIVLQWLAPSLSPQRSRSSCLYQPPPPKLNSNVRKKIVRHPVSAIDLQNKKVLSVIPVSQTVQRIATSVDDRWVFTADQTKPRLAVIDTQTDTVKTWVPLQDANRLPSEEQCRPGQQQHRS